MSGLLVPAWFLCEWRLCTDGYRDAELLLTRMVVVLAAVYLTGFPGSKRRLVSRVLFAAGRSHWRLVPWYQLITHRWGTTGKNCLRCQP